jgi:uncharacterized membrane protein
MDDESLVRVEQLERQLERLESEVLQLRSRLTLVEHTAPPRPASMWTPPLATNSRPVPPWPAPVLSPERTASVRPDLVLDSETVLKWGGVALVVLAVGFAVSTAISRGWIGPEVQLAGAMIVSFALIVAGVRLRPSRPNWTHALCSGGVAALFTTFASDLFLDQATDTIAFSATALIGIGGLVLARSIRSEWVAASAFFGGIVGWLVITDASGDVSFYATLAWISAIVALSLAVAVGQRWHALRFGAHGMALWLMLWLAEEAAHADERAVLLVVASLLAASLVRLPSIGDLTSFWQQLEVQLAAVTAVWAFGIIAIAFEVDGDRTIGSLAITVAAGAALVAFGVRRWILPPHFVSLLIGASVTLSIGFAVLLSTTAAFVALGVQGAGLVVLSRALGRNVRVLINAAVVSAIAAVFVIDRMIDAWSDDYPIGSDIAHLAIIGAIAVAVWQTGERVAWQVGALAILALVLIWLGSVLVHLPQGQAAVSVSWAIIGTAVLVAGAIRKFPEMGATGLAVLGLTVAKLLTVDLREVDTLWRAGLFFVIGLGIMRLGFMLPKLTREAPAEITADVANRPHAPTG